MPGTMGSYNEFLFGTEMGVYESNEAKYDQL